MTHPIIKTDNYILITSDEDIKEGDFYFMKPESLIIMCRSGLPTHKDWVKIIAHLPLGDSAELKLPLLPPLPDEEDVDKLAEKEFPHISTDERIRYLTIVLRDGFVTGHKKAKEKYKFTEEDMRKVLSEAFKASQEGYQITSDEIISSLSQPKLPVGFKCETKSLKQLPFNVEMSVDEINKPKIYKGVMQGEWIFE